MLNNEMLLEAIGGVRPEYVMEAQEALGYGEAKPRHSHKKLWRTALLAAVIAALLGVTAYAIGFFGMTDRRAELPASSSGTARYTVIPNGFQGSPTYLGSLEWWTFLDEQRGQQSGQPALPDPDLFQSDELRSIARLYDVRDQAMMDKLQEIAGKYGLSLYSESVSFTDLEQLYALSGIAPFMPGLDSSQRHGGYVFADGSFKDECSLNVAGMELSATLYRIRSGSIYPYGGIMSGSGDWDEYLYTSSQGYELGIASVETTAPQQGQVAYLSYTDSRQDWFIELTYPLPDSDRLAHLGLDAQALNEALADAIDFSALCQQNEAAGEIIQVPHGVEDNRDALEKLLDFQSSSMFCAARDFQDFFTAAFYDPYFTGTYGMEGYPDIDAKLDELAAAYGLNYATVKATGNRSYPDAAVFDNGAWFANLKENNSRSGRIEYIPKTALYTCLDKYSYTDFSEYHRIWPYETAQGESLILFSEGPEKQSRAGALYESETAWVLLTVPFYTLNPAHIENLAESISWSELC